MPFGPAVPLTRPLPDPIFPRQAATDQLSNPGEAPGRTDDGRVSPAAAQAPGDDAARRERAPPEGLQGGGGDLPALLVPPGDDRGEQDEGRVRRGAGAEGDGPPSAAGRERDAPERALREAGPGGAGREVHALRGGARPGCLEADPEGAEPDLPADDGSGDPEEGLHGLRRGLAADGEVRAAGLLRAVPGDGLQLRVAPDGRGGDLLLLRALRREPQDDRGGQPARAPEARGREPDPVRGGRGRDARGEPDLGLEEGAGDPARQVRPLGPQLRASAQAPGGRDAHARQRPGGEGDAQAEGRGRRPDRPLRSDARAAGPPSRASTRSGSTGSPRAAATRRRSSRRSSATTSGRSSCGWTRRRRRPSSSGAGAT